MTIPLENQLTTVLTPIFGNEIYPVVHPDPDGLINSVSNLFAIYTIQGGASFNKLDGDADLNRVRVQVSIYSVDYTEMKTSQKALSDAMKAANQLASQSVDSQVDHFEIAGAIANVSVSVPSEDFEKDTRRFYCHNEFYCWSRG